MNNWSYDITNLYGKLQQSIYTDTKKEEIKDDSTKKDIDDKSGDKEDLQDILDGKKSIFDEYIDFKTDGDKDKEKEVTPNPPKQETLDDQWSNLLVNIMRSLNNIMPKEDKPDVNPPATDDKEDGEIIIDDDPEVNPPATDDKEDGEIIIDDDPEINPPATDDKEDGEIIIDDEPEVNPPIETPEEKEEESGISFKQGLLYQNNELYTGEYIDKYYVEGRTANGIFNDKYYAKGKLGTGVYLDTFYDKGIAATGLYENVFYKDGKPGTGIYENKFYKEGNLGTGVAEDGKFYQNGNPFSGRLEGILYNKGDKFNGVCEEDNKFYQNGEPGTGIAENNKYYKNGDLGSGVYENRFYQNGDPATGIAEDNKYYKDGDLGSGLYQSKFYQNGDLGTGIAEDNKYYKDGDLLTGKADNGKYYSEGELFTGEVDGVLYKKGVEVIKGFSTLDGILYNDGDPYTGLYEEQFYKEGSLGSGLYLDKFYQNGNLGTGIAENNKYYKDGDLGSGLYLNKFYQNGDPATGIAEDNKYYKDGDLGSGLYLNKFYQNGDLGTGIAEDNKFYKEGSLGSGVYENKFYQNGDLATGIAEDNKYYKDGDLGSGLYLGKFYQNGDLGTGIAEDNKFYKEGNLGSGVYENKFYQNGDPATGIAENNKYYKNGDLGSGLYSGKFYQNGDLGTGIAEDKKFYKNGDLGTGLYQSKFYQNGDLGTGIAEDNKYYKNGDLGTGLYNGTYYDKGNLGTGYFEGKYYENGKETKLSVTYKDGYYYYGDKRASGDIDGVKYNNGKKVTGDVNGTMYKNGIIANGIVNGKIYKDGVVSNYTNDQISGLVKELSNIIDDLTVEQVNLWSSTLDFSSNNYCNLTIVKNNGEKIYTSFTQDSVQVITTDYGSQTSTRAGYWTSNKTYDNDGKVIKEVKQDAEFLEYAEFLKSIGCLTELQGLNFLTLSKYQTGLTPKDYPYFCTEPNKLTAAAKADIKMLMNADEVASAEREKALKAGKNSYQAADIYETAFDNYVKNAMVKDCRSKSDADILKSTKSGDVIQKSNGLYVNDNGELKKLNMTAEQYIELFPPVSRFSVEQGSIGDCYFLSTILVNAISSPTMLADILQLFSYDSKNNLTITFKGNDVDLNRYKGLYPTDFPDMQEHPVTFPNGKLFNCNSSIDQVDGAIGFKFLEQAFAKAIFSIEKETSIDSVDISKALKYIENDSCITAEYITFDPYEYKVAVDRPTSVADLKTMLDKYAADVNSGKILLNLTTDTTYAQKYIFEHHAYSVESIDTKNQTVNIVNPWTGSLYTTVTYAEIFKYFHEELSILSRY